MIVIGSDPHKRTHAFAAVEAATGELRSSEAVAASTAGIERALSWARRLDGERVWAIEDCRHVSGPLERFLISHGERIVRVPPRWTAIARNGARERGKTDPIDAVAVARAALREGIETLPAAFLDEQALEIRLLLDHHDNLVHARSRDQSRLRWHLHDLECPVDVPAAGLDRTVWLERLGRWLSRQAQSARVRVARRLLAAIRARTREIRELVRELAQLVADYQPALLDMHGCGPLTAAKLIAEAAGAQRFRTDAQFARAAGVAPIPASSGRTERHRLDRGGNRQLNCALHRIAVSAAHHDPDTIAYLARKQAEGKTRREALRCLKRHLARRVWTLLTTNANAPATAPSLT